MKKGRRKDFFVKTKSFLPRRLNQLQNYCMIFSHSENQGGGKAPPHRQREQKEFEDMKKEPILVIMAAGMGSRYGGNKQVDGVGPHGEILMNYGIYDAARAGFDKVVFVIKPEIRDLIHRLAGDALETLHTPDGRKVEFCYAEQTFDSVPDFYHIPEGRTKPFGTAHAVLCTRSYVHEPFCVINADDYYGVDAFKTIYAELSKLAESGEGTMVGYDLCNTVSEHGTVTRGVCHVNEQGMLDRVVETFHLKPCADGKIRDIQENGDGPVYAPETPVSMNFWGFTPWLFEKLDAYFKDFLRALPDGELKKECLLPSLIGELIDRGELSVSVLRSSARWFGMTYHEDKEMVQRELQKLHDAGVYPKTLRA